MGKGTIIADGQGNEKLYVFEDIMNGNDVKVAAGQTVTGFATSGSGTLKNGNVYDVIWDTRNDEVSVESDNVRTRPNGTINAGSTTFTSRYGAGGAWDAGDVIKIETEGDVGDNNTNYGGQSSIYGAPVENTDGGIAVGWLSLNSKE